MMFPLRDKFESILLRVKSLSCDVLMLCQTQIREVPAFLKLHKDIIIKLSLPLIIILVGYSACSSSQRLAKQNIRDIFAIADEIRAYYSDKPDYWHLDTNYAVTNRIISDSYVKDNRILLKSGKEILIGEGANAEPLMPLSQNFDIVMPNLTKAQCIVYAEFQLSNEQLLGINALSIVNSGGIHNFEWGNDNGLPVKKYATKDLCLDEKNTVIWSLR